MKAFVNIILLFSCLLTIAQQDDIDKFAIELHIGLNAANLSEPDDLETRYGLNTGMFLTYSIAKSSMSLKTGLVYSQQGARENVRVSLFEGSLEYDKVIKFDYLQSPFLIDYNFYRGAHLYGGLQLNYTLLAREESDSPSFSSERASNEPGDFIWSGIIGLQYDIMNHFFIRAQYDYGFSSASDTRYIDMGDTSALIDTDRKNRVATIAAGYRF